MDIIENISDADNIRQAYTKARNKVNSMISKSKRALRNISPQSESNPQILWSHVRSKLKTTTCVAPLLRDEMDKT